MLSEKHIKKVLVLRQGLIYCKKKRQLICHRLFFKLFSHFGIILTIEHRASLFFTFTPTIDIEPTFYAHLHSRWLFVPPSAWKLGKPIKKTPCLATRGEFIERINYSLIAVTAPEPTVRPPSRIAKRRPTSIAIGVISSTSISTLSPGMHISVPSGREITPVTSVVLK